MGALNPGGALLALLAFAGCGPLSLGAAERPAKEALAVSVSPSFVTLPPGGTKEFQASKAGARLSGVVWSVAQGAPGGTITSGGLYTAPPRTAPIRWSPKSQRRARAGRRG